MNGSHTQWWFHETGEMSSITVADTATVVTRSSERRASPRCLDSSSQPATMTARPSSTHRALRTVVGQ